MASKGFGRLLPIAALALATGCVTVKNDAGLQPPSALCSNLRATVGCPKGPVCCPCPKQGKTDATVRLKEWVFTGISADVVDMALQEAVRDGKLKKVAYADYDQVSILGFVTVFSLTAYGE